MPTDSNVLDDIIYARVLITLQRMQLEDQDRKLRDHLGDLVGDAPDGAVKCQESLKRAWIRAQDSLAVDGVDASELATAA